MNLTQDQLHELLSILDKQLAMFIGTTLGSEYLTKQQRDILGPNVDQLYKATEDPVLLNFHLGILSDVIGANATSLVTFDQLKRYITSGYHIPLSDRERETIKSIKNQALSDIRATQGKIFQDINNVVHNEGLSVRAQQESFIKEHILEGVQKRQSVRTISTNLAKLTGDWTRNFSKAVQYISHTALNEGRMAVAQKRYDNPQDAQFYFIVQNTACEHCVKAYLKDDKTREPKIFTAKQLLENGSNIGRKASDYLPTISALHVHSLTQGKTNILTDNGWKAIKNINEGDWVLTHKGRFKKVLSTIKHHVVEKDYPHKNIFKIKYDLIERGVKKKHKTHTISVTEEHKILTQLGWIEAKYLDKKIHKLVKLMKPCSCGCGRYIDAYSTKTCFDLECKKRISAISAKWLTSGEGYEERLNKQSETMKKKWASGKLDSNRDLLKSIEHRLKNSERMKAGGAIKAMKAASSNRTSKRQIKLFDKVKTIFSDAELEFEILGKSLDIAIPSLKVDIEYDGSIWHNREKNIAYDKKRDELLKQNGWHVIRYVDRIPSYSEIKDDVDLVANNSTEQYRFEELIIQSIVIQNVIPKYTQLYDLQVEEDESFVARGIVIHNCRCLLTEYQQGSQWDGHKFTMPHQVIYHPTVQRNKVRILVGNQEYFV